MLEILLTSWFGRISQVATEKNFLSQDCSNFQHISLKKAVSEAAADIFLGNEEQLQEIEKVTRDLNCLGTYVGYLEYSFMRLLCVMRSLSVKNARRLKKMLSSEAKAVLEILKDDRISSELSAVSKLEDMCDILHSEVNEDTGICTEEFMQAIDIILTNIKRRQKFIGMLKYGTKDYEAILLSTYESLKEEYGSIRDKIVCYKNQILDICAKIDAQIASDNKLNGNSEPRKVPISMSVRRE